MQIRSLQREYASKVMEGKLHDPVLSFELANGFRFIKVLSNYLDDVQLFKLCQLYRMAKPKPYPQKHIGIGEE